MHSILGDACIGLLALPVTGVAYAGTGIQRLKPGVVELAGIGAVAAIVVKLARRRK